MDNIVIVGSSGHAKVIIDIVEKQARFRIAGLLDRFRNPGEQTLGYEVIGREENLSSLRDRYRLKGIIVAIGDNFIRSKVVKDIVGICPDLNFVTAIHPSATLGKDVHIEQGTVIMAGVVVNPSVRIGQFCILNSNSSIDHDSVMGDFSSLAPRAVVGGGCSIAAFSAISIGATLIHNVSVGEHTIIGAGAIVLKSIDARQVAYGNPARAMRAREIGEKYLS